MGDMEQLDTRREVRDYFGEGVDSLKAELAEWTTANPDVNSGLFFYMKLRSVGQLREAWATHGGADSPQAKFGGDEAGLVRFVEFRVSKRLAEKGRSLDDFLPPYFKEA